jgi:hypothetical protein
MMEKLLENETIIGALIGFVGVALGLLASWVKDWLECRRLRNQQATYLAVRVICMLGEYTDKCVKVVQDDGTIMGQAAERDNQGFEHYIPQVALPPAPDFPDDMDWKALDGNLMYRILAFPNLVRSTNEGINFVANEVASPPDYDELFEARWDGYANLGLKAVELVRLLRNKYGLPEDSPNEWNPDWNPKDYLEQKKKKVEDRRKRYAADFESAFSPLIQTDNKSEQP